jgi:putative hydrolase of HD superfamily
MHTEIVELYKFIQRAENLKNVLRHSWTSDKTRQESVGDHSWMMGLLAMSLFDQIGFKVDQLKVMKMIVLHDLAEAIVGDIPAFADAAARAGKYEAEQAAMLKITKGLPDKTRQEFLDIWEEMEANETPEAKLAQAIDKVEVFIQHIIADIDTWDDGDYRLGPYHKDEYNDIDPFLRAFKDYVNDQFWQKMESANKLDRLQPGHIARRSVKQAGDMS